MRFIYDIEIFKNLFLVIFHNVENGERKVFEISRRRDDRQELHKFLVQKPELVGYNNLHFDYPLFYEFLLLVRKPVKGRQLVKTLKEKADKLIGGALNRIPMLIPQIDLMKINHYDPMGAKATSLKALQFVMRMENIQELPYPHDATLEDHEIEEVVRYCHNDIDATLQFYHHSLQGIELREGLREKFSFIDMNYNDVKMGEQILVNMLRREMEVEHLGQTYRESIRFGDIIFPFISFNSEPLQRFLFWLQQQKVKETKGAFNRIEMERVEDIRDLVVDEKRNLVKGMLKNLIIKYQDVEFTFGTGGIHQSVKNEIIESSETHLIKSCDVASMYPNIAIQNELSPAHLGKTFCQIYNQIYQERKQHAKSSPINKAYKLALNGSYGKANSLYSELYDPQWVLSITLNGQLQLCMLIEALMEIEGARLLISNTDGCEFLIPRESEEEYMEICREWEELTKLQLEYVNYRKLIVSNVNNYIGIYEDGRTKNKGAYEIEREYHKNHSMLIVPKAVHAFYVEGTPVEEFIRNHEDIYDFFLLARIKGKSSRLILRTEKEDLPCQKNTRYLVTVDGGTLIKIMPPLPGKEEEREFNEQKGWLVTTCNDMRGVDVGKLKTQINYDYYINEARKLLIGNEHENQNTE